MSGGSKTGSLEHRPHLLGEKGFSARVWSGELFSAYHLFTNFPDVSLANEPRVSKGMYVYVYIYVCKYTYGSEFVFVLVLCNWFFGGGAAGFCWITNKGTLIAKRWWNLYLRNNRKIFLLGKKLGCNFFDHLLCKTQQSVRAQNPIQLLKPFTGEKPVHSRQ